MCDCYNPTCEEPGCGVRLPVHISDFCVPRRTVEVRCHKHPPPEPDDWWAFDECDQTDVPGGTMYLRYTGGPELLEAANERNKAMLKSIGLDDSYATGYRVGDDGDICPNLAEYTERKVDLPFDKLG